MPVHEPLVLISQIQRSGGTLLSQLFDGDPERMRDRTRPASASCRSGPCRPSTSACSRLFATLHEPLLAEWIETGFVKDLTDLRKQCDLDVSASSP